MLLSVYLLMPSASVSLTPLGPNRTVPDAQLYFVHTVRVPSVPCRLLAVVVYGSGTCSAPSRLGAQIHGLIDVDFDEE